MPAPTKSKDELMQDIETALGALMLEKPRVKLLSLRIEQAIARHPDLFPLLEPVKEELIRSASVRNTMQTALQGAMKKVVSG